MTAFRREGGAEELRISTKGYEFLLQNVHVQMWRFVQQYLTDGNQLEILSFLCQLSYCRVGQDYPVKALSKAQQALLDEFVGFGLIYRRSAVSRPSKGSKPSKPSSRFYPTSVACNLLMGPSGIRNSGGMTETATSNNPTPSSGPSPSSSGNNNNRSSKQQPGVVNLSHFETIVQTNFQVVAYTTNDLHFRMLGLFAELKTVLPNAIIAVITRRAFQAALADGITAAQVLSFLETNLHPLAQQRRVKASGSKNSSTGAQVIPETVREQLHLWEQERDRVKYDQGVLHTFGASHSTEGFRELVEVTIDMDVHLWSDPGTKTLIVKQTRPDEVDVVGEYMRQQSRHSHS
uniref:General transcription factor IIH subunit 4 n=1 Tax=Octactis speculum TaxID=3111310 RepID=A0A7S2AJ54_9STRA